MGKGEKEGEWKEKGREGRFLAPGVKS